MSRAIKLSKIHALNWYGYRDTLPVNGNLVLAGVTGSGKSILMDLLMLILVGPQRAQHHFNRSATGGKSDRTIKSYCLLDTKREENGQPQYFHHNGVTTYIAAEFTWPDGERVETWGLRLEYRNSHDDAGTITPFFCPASLERDDFLSISEENGKSYPSPLADFKRLVDSHQGRLFSSAKDYLRDMANPSHLNFNQDVIQRLLPSAMSFTNLKSFDDFCRQFVLPNEEIPVQDVISSFRDFESYQRELSELKGQLERLLTIRDFSQIQKDALRNKDVARYLSAEHSLKHSTEKEAQEATHFARLQEENAADEARLIELKELKTEAQTRRDTNVALLNESEEGRLYKNLTDRIGSIELHLQKLRDISTKIDRGLVSRIQSAKSWMTDVSYAPLTPSVVTADMKSALETLETCKQEDTLTSLRALATAADDLCRKIKDRFRSDADQLRHLRQEKDSLTADIQTLQGGLPPIAQPLLDALHNELPTLPGETPPRALRELCEVDDEAWRAAAEIALDSKFAILVSSEHYAQSLGILENITDSKLNQSGAQYIIDAGAIIQESSIKQQKGSLAEIFTCSDPAAQAYIDQLFGDVIRVNSASELEDHTSAICPDGIFKRGSTITRSTPYDDKPFIGEAGLKRQLLIKETRLEAINADLLQLEPRETEVNRLLSERAAKISDHSEIGAELVRVENLPQVEQEHEDLMAQLSAISTNELDSLRFQIDELDIQISSFEQENNSILRKGGLSDMSHSRDRLKNLQEDKARREEQFFRTQQEIDIHTHQAHYTQWDQEMSAQFPAHDVLAAKFRDAVTEAEKTIISSTGDIKVAMADFKTTYSPKFDDLPSDGLDLAPYEKILSTIEDADIPKYEQKSVTERSRWESLFRTQVLSRMQQALKKVENIIALLNLQLKRPIGNDRYKISNKQNPEFTIYRELIDRNALHHEDELFFSSMSGELQDALADFLQILTKNSNSPEAARLLDYRQYFDYDLLVTDIRDEKLKPVSVDKQSGKMSGGENQSPYFVAILASYLHAYNRHETRHKEPSLALVPIDEAFSKLSGERIQNCINAMSELDLQGMFSMSSGNIPYAFSQCDELIIISRKEERKNNRIGVRNVPVVLMRESEEGQKWMKDNDLEGAEED